MLLLTNTRNPPRTRSSSKASLDRPQGSRALSSGAAVEVVGPVGNPSGTTVSVCPLAGLSSSRDAKAVSDRVFATAANMVRTDLRLLLVSLWRVSLLVLWLTVALWRSAVLWLWCAIVSVPSSARDVARS